MSTRFKSSLGATGLAEYVSLQLNHFFPDDRPLTKDDLVGLIEETTTRVEHCFSHINIRYYFNGNHVIFNHLNGDHYAMFLYLLSRVALQHKADETWLSKIFLLNKALHGIDAYFEVELPSVFLFVHPLGAVLGRARYDDYFAVYQRCGVGSNHDVHPVMGRYFTMHPGSSVLGRCRIGENVGLAPIPWCLMET